MNASDKLWSTMELIEKLRAATGLGIIVTSAYLLSRSVEVLLARVEPFSSAAQVRFQALSFSFLSLSIAWPLVIGFLCVLLKALNSRAREARRLLDEVDDGERSGRIADVLSVDPVSPTHEELSLRRILGVLPAVAIVAHGVALSIYSLRFFWVHAQTVPLGDLTVRMVGLGASFVAMALGFAWSGELRGSPVPATRRAIRER